MRLAFAPVLGTWLLLQPGLSLAQSRPDPAPARAAMAKLDRMVGVWEGEATIQLGPGEPRRIVQVERVEKKLDGTALLIEGTGHEKTDGPGPGRVVFQALAVAAYDPASDSYKMHAFRDNGLSIVATASLTDTGLVWGFDDGHGGKVKYNITLEDDKWTEIGEYLRDGQPPRKFFEMTVRRKPQAPAGEVSPR